MRITGLAIPLVCLAAIAALARSRAAECRDGSCTACTGPGLEARCKAEWTDAKTKQPEYAMKCEYACARGRDSWHAPRPECRCRPPCGELYVKKRLYKTDKEKVERVPKYEVETVPAGPCGHSSCLGGRPGCRDPLGLLTLLHGW